MVLPREKNHRRAAFPLMAALVLLLANPVFGFTAKVTGIITDAQGNPLPKVQVLFEVVEVPGRAQGSVVAKLKTKKTGKFTYPFLDTGDWRIYPQFEGYVVLKMSVLSMDSEGTIRFEDDELKIAQGFGHLSSG